MPLAADNSSRTWRNVRVTRAYIQLNMELE